MKHINVFALPLTAALCLSMAILAAPAEALADEPTTGATEEAPVANANAGETKAQSRQRIRAERTARKAAVVAMNSDESLMVREPIEDMGTDLPFDPYTHTRGLTDGQMEAFRELFVDPNTFAAEVMPKGPPTIPPIEKVDYDLGDGNGAGLSLRLTFDPKRLGKTTPANVLKTLKEAGHASADSDAVGTYELTVGESGLLALMNTRVQANKTWGALVDFGTLSVQDLPQVEEEPEEGAESTPEEAAPAAETAPEDGEVVEEVIVELPWNALAYTAPEGSGTTGNTILPVDNGRSSWATVVINDTKVGIIGPLTRAYVKGVKPGTYDINFTWSNGFSQTQIAETVPAMDGPRMPGVTPVGMKGPGVE